MNVLLIPYDGSKYDDPTTEDLPDREVSVRSHHQHLKRINNRTSLYWTAQALAQSNRVQNVQVFCEPEYYDELRLELPDDKRFQLVDFGLNEFSEIESEPIFKQLTSVEEIARKQIKAPTLVISCTTPHWTGNIYDDIISHIRGSSLDSALFYIQDKNVQPKSGEMTFDPLFFCKESVYGLPLAVIGPELVFGTSGQLENFAPELKRLMKAEEKFSEFEKEKAYGFRQMFPLGLKAVRTVGFSFIWKFVKQSLTPALIEKQIKRIFNCRFELVELSEPHLALRLSNDTHHAKIEALLS